MNRLVKRNLQYFCYSSRATASHVLRKSYFKSIFRWKFSCSKGPTINSLFHIEISGNISQNTFLTRQDRTSEASPFCRVRKVFLVYFSRNRDMNAIYHVSLTFRVIFWAFLQNFCSLEKQVQKSKTEMSRKAGQEKLKRHDKGFYFLRHGPCLNLSLAILLISFGLWHELAICNTKDGYMPVGHKDH